MRIDREEAGLSEVEEAMFGRGMANTNAVIAIMYVLATRGMLDRQDVEQISTAFSKPLVIEGPRENILLTDLHNEFDKQMSAILKMLAAK